MWTVEKGNPLTFLLSLIICMPWTCWWNNMTHNILMLKKKILACPNYNFFSPHLHTMGASCDQKMEKEKLDVTSILALKSCCYLLGEQKCASFPQLHNDFTLINVAMENNYENNKNIVESAFWTLNPTFKTLKNHTRMFLFLNDHVVYCDGTAGLIRIKWSL